MPLRFLVVGATGRTGRLVVDEAIARGHEVTALVRVGNLPARERLRVVVGDPRRADDLAGALAGHDAVISCLGQRSRDDATLLRDAAAAMLTAMSRGEACRYLVVSQGLLFPTRNPIVVLLRLVLARTVADSTAMERSVRAGVHDWTILRPPRLTDGGAARGYRLRVDTLPAGAWSMQRVDLARALLDEAQHARHVRAIVGVGSA